MVKNQEFVESFRHLHSDRFPGNTFNQTINDCSNTIYGVVTVQPTVAGIASYNKHDRLKTHC